MYGERWVLGYCTRAGGPGWRLENDAGRRQLVELGYRVPWPLTIDQCELPT
jgi:hypothetical protein